MVIASKINGRRPATALHIRLPRIGSQVGARNNAQLETGAPKVNTPLMTINHPKLKQNMADVIGRPPLSRVRFAINFPKQEIRSHGAPGGKPPPSSALAPSRHGVFGIALQERSARVAAGKRRRIRGIAAR
jgi:hypothetical protein